MPKPPPAPILGRRKDLTPALSLSKAREPEQEREPDEEKTEGAASSARERGKQRPYTLFFCSLLSASPELRFYWGRGAVFRPRILLESESEPAMKTPLPLLASLVIAGLSTPVVWAAPALPAAPAAAPAPAATAAGNSAQPVLDSLVGKHEVIGFTRRGGERFLGRVLSGDHGLYVVQTFHYVTAPATVTETTPETTATVGRRGRVSYRTKKIKTRETTQKIVPDDTAVAALIRGVGGPSFRPAEQPAGREMVSPAEIVSLQVLRPPKKAEASASTPAAAQPAQAPNAPDASPAKPSLAKASSAKWTLKTLWAAE